MGSDFNFDFLKTKPGLLRGWGGGKAIEGIRSRNITFGEALHMAQPLTVSIEILISHYF